MPRTKNHGRSEGLRRVLLLRKHLDGRRYAHSLIDLAQRFDVSTRTIRRDLELLESIGERLPIWRQDDQLADIRRAG